MSDKEPDSGQDESRVVRYWSEIAPAWTDAVRSGSIKTRELVTNNAIVDAVLEQRPSTVLDIGCGEGWLCRTLEEKGVRTIGVDAIQDLVSRARSAGPGDYRIATYDDIADGALGLKVDLVVCNFSLLGKDSVDAMVRNIATLLRANGSLIIQTLHPAWVDVEHPYADGWRESPWQGVIEDIRDPSPWYFRRVETWIQLVLESGLRLIEVREPINPTTGKPASIIFVARAED